MLAKVTPLILRFIIVSLAMAFIHYLLIRYTDLHYDLPELFEAYVFIVLIHLGSYVLTVRAAVRHFDKTAFVFSGLTFLKMGLTVAYLWPMLRGNGQENAFQLIQFFTVYFLFLFMEARAVFKLLNKGSN